MGLTYKNTKRTPPKKQGKQTLLGEASDGGLPLQLVQICRRRRRRRTRLFRLVRRVRPRSPAPVHGSSFESFTSVVKLGHLLDRTRRFSQAVCVVPLRGRLPSARVYRMECLSMPGSLSDSWSIYVNSTHLAYLHTLYGYGCLPPVAFPFPFVSCLFCLCVRACVGVRVTDCCSIGKPTVSRPCLLLKKFLGKRVRL